MEHKDFPHYGPEPSRREKPIWEGEVDTKTPGHFYDTHRPHHDHHPGYEIPPIKPLFVPGMSEAEQIAILANRVDELTKLLKDYDKKVWGAYDEIVHSAICNDAYYDEIVVENGYLPDAGTAYKVVHIPYIDKVGQPIFLELGLAYNNTTNSGLHENAFDCSLRTVADKLIPAYNVVEKWTGVNVWNGAPIQTDSENTKFTLGVLENGFMKLYNNAATLSDLAFDKCENSMGVQGLLVSGGVKTPDCYAENATEILPRVGIGMNYTTKERIIIIINSKAVTGVSTTAGLTSDQMADLFVKYGCTVAAETANGDSCFMMDKGEFAYMPTTVNTDNVPTVPYINCFWYISKGRHYRNKYVQEVAELMQKFGRSIWQGMLSTSAVDKIKVDLRETIEKLEQEIKDREAGDSVLDNKIEALDTKVEEYKEELDIRDVELDTRITTEVATLNERIDAEVKVLEEADIKLDARITQEVATINERINEEVASLNAKDVKEVMLTAEGTRDVYKIILNDGTTVTVPIVTYNYDELVRKIADLAEVEKNLAAEIQARKEADDMLQANITAEAANRELGDGEIKVLLESEKMARADGDNQNKILIEAEASYRETADDTLRSQIQTEAEERESEDNETRTLLNVQMSVERNARISGDNELQENIDNLNNTLVDAIQAEQTARIQADATLKSEYIRMVVEEASSRQTEDAAIRALITAEQVARENGDEALTSSLSELREDYTSFVTQTSGNFTEVRASIDTILVDLNNVKSTMDLMSNQMSSLNASVTAVQQTIASMETSFESVKQAVSEMQTAWEEYKTSVDAQLVEIKESLASYLPLAGGTMSGGINMDGNSVTNVGAPVENGDAVNKEYVDTSLEGYLPLTGGTMEGVLYTPSGNLSLLEDYYYDSSQTEPSTIRFKLAKDVERLSRWAEGLRWNLYGIEATPIVIEGNFPGNRYLPSGSQWRADILTTSLNFDYFREDYLISGGMFTSYFDSTLTNLFISRNAPYQHRLIKLYIDGSVRDIDEDNVVTYDGEVVPILFYKTGSNSERAYERIDNAMTAIADYTYDTESFRFGFNQHWIPSWRFINKRFLALTGGTLTGTLNMADQQISNVSLMTVGTTTYQTTSGTANVSVKATGDDSQGVLEFNDASGNPVVLRDVDTPSEDLDAANKGYVDATMSEALGRYLPLTGGTISGDITLGGTLSMASKAATIDMAGGVITNAGTPEAETDVANKAYVDTTTGSYLPLTGGTLTGDLSMASGTIFDAAERMTLGYIGMSGNSFSATEAPAIKVNIWSENNPDTQPAIIEYCYGYNTYSQIYNKLIKNKLNEEYNTNSTLVPTVGWVYDKITEAKSEVNSVDVIDATLVDIDTSATENYWAYIGLDYVPLAVYIADEEIRANFHVSLDHTEYSATQGFRICVTLTPTYTTPPTIETLAIKVICHKL